MILPIFLLAAGGNSLGLWGDPSKTATEHEYFSKKDARAPIDLCEVIDAAVAIGLPLMQTNVVQPDITAILKAAKGVAILHGGTGSLPKPLLAVSKDDGGAKIRARRGVLTACSAKTTLTRLLPRGVLEHEKLVAAEHIPTRKRGIADAKVDVVLSGHWAIDGSVRHVDPTISRCGPKQLRLEDRGGRVGGLKARLVRDRRRNASVEDTYSSGPNEPFPGQGGTAGRTASVGKPR